MNSSDDVLTKLHLELPNHWWHKGESIWAKALGSDRYEIRNVPFCAYGLNFGDVVLATPDQPDLKPEIRRVVASSGHRTLRTFSQKASSLHSRLSRSIDLSRWAPRLSELTHVSYVSTYLPASTTKVSGEHWT